MFQQSIVNFVDSSKLNSLESEISEIEKYLQREQRFLNQPTNLKIKKLNVNHNETKKHDSNSIEEIKSNSTPNNESHIEFTIQQSGLNTRPNYSHTRLSARNPQPKSNWTIKPIEQLYNKSLRKINNNDIKTDTNSNNISVTLNENEKAVFGDDTQSPIPNFNSSFNSSYSTAPLKSFDSDLAELETNATGNAKLLRDKLINALLNQKKPSTKPNQQTIDPALQQAREIRDELIEQLLQERAQRHAGEYEIKHKLNQSQSSVATELNTTIPTATPKRNTQKAISYGGNTSRPLIAATILSPNKKSKLSKLHSKIAKNKKQPLSNNFTNSSASSNQVSITHRTTSIPGSPYKSPQSVPLANYSSNLLHSIHAHAQLHSERLDDKTEKEKLKTAVEEEFKENYTFKPVINQTSIIIDELLTEENEIKEAANDSDNEYNKYSTHSKSNNKEHIKAHTQSKAPDDALNKRIENWNKQQLIGQSKRNKLAQSIEQEQLKECTFKPKLFTKTDSIIDNNEEQQQQQRSIETRTKPKIQSTIETELQNATFQPKITKKAQNLANYQPIQERVHIIQEEKQRKLLDQKEKLENQQQFSFQPHLNKLSLALAETNREQIENHLQESKAKKQENIKLQSDKSFTFKPEINPVSELIIQAKSKENPQHSEFLTRQQIQLELLENKHKKSKNLAKQDEQASFKPNIGNANEILKQSKYRQAYNLEDETTDSRDNYSESNSTVSTVDRLYNLDKQRNDALKQQLQEQYYQAHYTFKPQINAVSQLIAKSTPFQQLTHNPHIHIDQDTTSNHDSITSSSNTQSSNYTFKPAMNSHSIELLNSQGIQSHYSQQNLKTIVKQIEKQKLQKEFERQLELQERLETETNQCTFQPEIREFDRNAVNNNNNQPLNIPGLTRYMELKQLHANQIAEQLERERKVFFLDVDARDHKKDENSVLFTIPKPFHFETAKKQQENEKKSQQIKKDIEKENNLKFVPETQEKKTKQILDNILKEIETEANAATENNNAPLSNNTQSNSGSRMLNSSKSKKKESTKPKGNNVPILLLFSTITISKEMRKSIWIIWCRIYWQLYISINHG